MPEHTPEHTRVGASVLKFIQHESGSHGDWMIRVVEHPDSPTITLNAWRDDEVESRPESTLAVPTGQVHLTDEELDESTKTRIRDWLASL